MTLNFSVTFNGSYIRVEHPRGCELTEKGVLKFWRELAELCREYQCFKALVIWIAPKRRLSVMNSFDSGETASRFLSGVKLACCFHEYEPDDQTELFVNAAYNRGVNIAVFTEENKALYWLVGASLAQENPGES